MVELDVVVDVAAEEELVVGVVAVELLVVVVGVDVDVDVDVVLVPFVLVFVFVGFVGTGLTIEEIGVVVLTGAAPGLNGVFCFCMLYMRLGHNITRTSRPNNSRPKSQFEFIKTNSLKEKKDEP